MATKPKPKVAPELVVELTFKRMTGRKVRTMLHDEHGDVQFFPNAMEAFHAANYHISQVYGKTTYRVFKLVEVK